MAANRGWMYDELEVNDFLLAHDAEFHGKCDEEAYGILCNQGWRLVFALCGKVRWAQRDDPDACDCNDTVVFEVTLREHGTREALANVLKAGGGGLMVCDCGKGGLHVADYSGAGP